jgi:hypothetical protein
MEIIFWLMIKHFICDFPLQTRYQCCNKGIYGHPGGIIHALIHALGTVIVFIWPVGLVAVVCGLIDGIIHYHIDWWKMAINAKYNLQPENKWFWNFLGIDQLLHFFTYYGLVWLII